MCVHVYKHAKLGTALCLIVLPLQPANEGDETERPSEDADKQSRASPPRWTMGNTVGLINRLVSEGSANHYPSANTI